jgi:hypothetical protein
MLVVYFAIQNVILVIQVLLQLATRTARPHSKIKDSIAESLQLILEEQDIHFGNKRSAPMKTQAVVKRVACYTIHCAMMDSTQSVQFVAQSVLME